MAACHISGWRQTNKHPCVAKEGEESARRIVYDNEEIERLLDRSQEGVGETKFGANDYLSSFKVATFALKDQEQETVEQKEPSPEPEKMVRYPAYNTFLSYTRLLGGYRGCGVLGESVTSPLHPLQGAGGG